MSEANTHSVVYQLCHTSPVTSYYRAEEMAELEKKVADSIATGSALLLKNRDGTTAFIINPRNLIAVEIKSKHPPIE